MTTMYYEAIPHSFTVAIDDVPQFEKKSQNSKIVILWNFVKKTHNNMNILPNFKHMNGNLSHEWVNFKVKLWNK